jgi:Co/Zn/Cd efflux system component
VRAQPSASTLDACHSHGGLPWCSGLNLALVAALVIVGVTAHSLGVLAAGVDYLADAAAIAVSLFAIQLAHQPERSAAHANATNIAALVNAVRTAFREPPVRIELTTDRLQGD